MTGRAALCTVTKLTRRVEIREAQFFDKHITGRDDRDTCSSRMQL